MKKCVHYYNIISKSHYYDYSGIRVLKVKYTCKFCGKKLTKKYMYGHC